MDHDRRRPATEGLLSEIDWTRRLCASLVGGNPADADDLRQELWLATLQSPRLGPGLRSWLRKVARNLGVSRARGETRRLAREVAAGAQAASPATPEELVARAELHRLLVELVLALEEPTRQTVLARYFEQRSAEEIARATGSPSGTVRWRLKMGLDELRARLEERLGPSSERRLRAWAALGVSAPSWRWKAPAAWGTSVAAAGVLLLSWPCAREPSRPEMGHASLAATALEKAARPVPGGASASPWRPGPIEPCRGEVGRLRLEVARLEAERIRVTRADRLFQEGEPNLRATIELQPLMAEMLRGDLQSFPAHSFECRGRACRLAFTLEERPPGNRVGVEPGWLMRMQFDEDLRSRFGFQVGGPGGGGPTTDPLTGRSLREEVVFLKLADPAGRPVEVQRRWKAPAPPPVPAASLPTTAEACAREQAELLSRTGQLGAEVERLRPAHERFPGAAPNPVLTRLISEEARRLDTEGVGSRVDCRENLCELSVESVAGMERLFRRISRDRLRTRIDRLSSSNQGIVFFVSPVERADGEAVLRQRVAGLRASGALERCHDETPLSGTLRVRLYLPRTGERNDDGAEGKISARYGGTLGWTSLRTCVEAALEEQVLRPSLPDPVHGTWWEELFSF